MTSWFGEWIQDACIQNTNWKNYTIPGLLKVICILETILIQSLSPFWAKCHMSLLVISWNIYKTPSPLTKLASKHQKCWTCLSLTLYVRLMWSNFWIGHPLDTYVWIINDKTQKGHQNHIFLNENGLCAQNLDTNLSSIANVNGRTYVITSRKKESLLASQLWFRNLTWQSTWFAIANWMRIWFPIRFNNQKCMWSWKCPQWGDVPCVTFCNYYYFMASQQTNWTFKFHIVSPADH